MPKLTVEGVGQFDVPTGKRLISALIDEAGTDQLHACGGSCRCTTCRVEFIEGQPDQMTVAEQQVLQQRELTDEGIRLSCQVQCDQDMHVRLVSRLEGSGRKDQGGPVSDQIEPAPQWVQR